MLETIIRIIIQIGLLRLLIVKKKPLLCSSIYTFYAFIILLIKGHFDFGITIVCMIVFGCASFYFWLLNRFDYYENTLLWWAIALAGLFIGFI